MREWWQDLLLQAAAGMLGTVAAAGVVALAARSAGLFDAASGVRVSVFVRRLLAFTLLLLSLVGLALFAWLAVSGPVPTER